MLTVLRVVRELSVDGTTMGALYLNGHWQCWTVEDEIREDERPVAEWKIAGKTAIPAGRYGLRLSMSNRFKRVLPELLEVPGFTGVRIHAGNTIEDTEGCLLVGRTRSNGRIVESRQAFEALFGRLQAATAASDTIMIDMENPPSVAREPAI